MWLVTKQQKHRKISQSVSQAEFVVLISLSMTLVAQIMPRKVDVEGEKVSLPEEYNELLKTCASLF